MEKLNLESLNEEQKNAVLTTEGPVIVSAGAGSGKTKVLTYRIAHLIKNGIKPSEIIAITFTNKAANEMKDRVQNLLGESCNIWISTFHSACVKILRMFYNSHFSIYDDKDSEKIIKALIKEREWNDNLLDCVVFHLSEMKSNCYELNEYVDLIKNIKNCDQIVELMVQYEECLNKNNALDFDDLLAKTYFLLKNNKEVFEYFNNKFSYVLIDEFQDTNIVQYNIAKLLSFKKRNLFVVGDEDQCIYSWRGAKMENIMNFEKDFPECKLFKLEKNYRSTKKILDCANIIIKNNTSRYEKNLYTDNEDGVRIEYYPAYNETFEADYLAQQIINLKQYYDYNYNDFAVLVRLNSLTRKVEESFLNHNLPHKIFGGVKFYSRKEIKDFLSYLKFVVNPKDDENFTRMVSFPRRGIGDAGIENLKRYNIKQCAYENLKEQCEIGIANKKLQEFYKNIENMISVKDKMNVSDFANYIFEQFKIKESFDQTKDEEKSRLENIKELLASIKEFEKNNISASIEAYIESVSLIMDIDSFSENDEKITIATVHAVKGLEFKVVFVIGLEENRFPLIRNGYSSNAEIEEERRLMYVAITRAKERLYLSYSKSRYMYNKIDYCTPSRFLKELGFIKNLNDIIKEGNNFEKVYKKSNDGYITTSLRNNFGVNKTSLQINYEIGNLILHPKFGVGKVIDINKNEKMISINFNGIGIRKLTTDAPIKIIKNNNYGE